jgi:signal transduction histidine kinase
MKRPLLWKLLTVTTLPAIAVFIALVWLAIDQLAADYFMALMDKYMVSPTETHRMFLTAIHRYLLGASLVALLVSCLLSYLMIRRVLRPLASVTRASRQIAAGNFTVRVETSSGDEVGELGGAFNRMADSLEKLERLRKTMVSDVAHELRTPLTNLRGYMEGLADGVIPPEKSTFEMLQAEILRLVHLVEDLGQLARADAAQAFLNRQPLDLRKEIEGMIALYRPNLEAKGIVVRTRFADEVRTVAADRDKVLQAVRNLVENACKYTPPGGFLEVATERSPGGVRTVFSNSGPAIPTADLPYIFERFYRADPSRSRAAGGAGIGLAIVKELIEAHGGSVGASSDNDSTQIWFILPESGG